MQKFLILDLMEQACGFKTGIFSDFARLNGI